LRGPAAECLKRSRARRITEAYRRAYSDGKGLESEFEGWEGEASWLIGLLHRCEG